MRGWQVLTLDVDPRFNCDITMDVRDYHYVGPRPDFFWFSMPCTEFSRESMPWCKTGKIPDMSLIHACLRIRDEANPVYWGCENVRGAVEYFRPIMGSYRYKAGPFYIWGNFPIPPKTDMSRFRKKESYGSNQREERAKIPFELSEKIAVAIELQEKLF